MTYTHPQIITFETFIAEYGDNPRYELADGELIDMEPTGPHEAVGGKLTTYVGMAILAQHRPWFIPRTCLIRPLAEAVTARRPDVIGLDETMLFQEPLWEKEPVITLGSSIKLIAEIVSTNWETDYARKLEEYALLGVPEYWIVDYRGLGGTAFIGKPKQPTFTVCQLIGDEYQRQQYHLGEAIYSPLLPSISLHLDDIMPHQ